MKDRALLRWNRWLIPLPAAIWHRVIGQNAAHARAGLAFMTPEHHQVRNFVVRELPQANTPLTPEFIAQSLALPLERVVAILSELERRMTFLFRRQGTVTWAYPVTADETPHRITLSTGEETFAA